MNYGIMCRIPKADIYHTFLPFPPSEWAQVQGATHTLCTIDGERPARLLKTVAYVGVDEDEYGNCVWEKWQIRTPNWYTV
jgi:hypothetical protein